MNFIFLCKTIHFKIIYTNYIIYNTDYSLSITMLIEILSF